MAGQSYIDQKTDLMNQLLWTNLLRQWVMIEFPIALAAIPYVGPFLAMAIGRGPILDFVVWLLDKEIVWKFFYLLCRYGVFTSINWQEDVVYASYEKKAAELIGVINDPRGKWTPAQDKAFSDAAFNLIELHFRKPA